MTPELLLSRRTLLAAALTVGLASSPRGAIAGTPTFAVDGEIGAVYRAHGGLAVLGRPLADDVRVRLRGVTTDAQRFEHGTVWWGAGKGRVDLPEGERVRLQRGRNFRPVVGVADLWRTDDLDDLTALDERIVRDLGIATVIAMNGGSDPTISGVSNLEYRISNVGSHRALYRGYVTRAASRRSVGRVLTAVATSTAPVAVHCHAGKDRTGWVCDLMQTVAGVSKTTRDADYLVTKRYTGKSVDLDWLQAARDKCSESYGSTAAYLTKGCGMSAATLDRLERRLAV